LDRSTFGYSTALEFQGEGIKCETDFAVLQHRRADEIEMAIGECKGKGRINAEDMRKMRSVYDRLRTIRRVEPYIILSKTADAFEDDEIELFKKVNNDGIPFVLFTNRELEPYHPYWKEDGGTDSDIPEKYPHSLSDLRRNSIARYLG
jgi:hypothetical protein